LHPAPDVEHLHLSAICGATCIVSFLFVGLICVAYLTTVWFLSGHVKFELHSQKLFAGSYCGCATVKLEMRNCKLGRAAGDLSEKWEKKSQKRGELLKYIKVML